MVVFSLVVRAQGASSEARSDDYCGDAVLSNTSIRGADDYANFVLSHNDANVCHQACCSNASCTAWVVAKTGDETDKNCSRRELCCWLRASTLGVEAVTNATSSYVYRKPQPRHPPSHGYVITAKPKELKLFRRVAHVDHELARINTASLENDVVPGAWNMLRTVVNRDTVQVWLNPTFHATGFQSQPDDRFRMPHRLRPLISIRDPQSLGAGGVAAFADGSPARMDYISALPPPTSGSFPHTSAEQSSQDDMVLF